MELHAKFVNQMKFLSIGSIASEYSTIRSQTSVVKRNLGLTTESGGLTENVKKNRYKDILPYDQTRVVLNPLTSPFDSDYINANFIQGATETKKYIATQGPLSATLVDFWRMIWQYEVKVIMMACREIEMRKRKCERYWAAHQETSQFGPFLVSNMSESFPNDEVVVRSLVVQYLNEKKTVNQFQYTAWPDHDIPYTAEGILGMMDMARNAQADSPSPVLIHCSAGCGRTGVICAVDYIHDLLVTKQIREEFSIMKIVLDMRRQRQSAVQTQEQYQFVFSAVAQIFQRSLQRPVNPSYSLSQSSGSVSRNVETVKCCQLGRIAASPASSHKLTNRSTSLQPIRSGDHTPGQKMNDTYAVVNKTRQTIPKSKPSILAPSSKNHYDNEETGGASGAQATPLYSTVRPRSRALHPTLSDTPIYDTAIPANARLSPESLDHLSGYELVKGECSKHDDYEYVSEPIRETPSSCSSPTSLGFNCRVKKPKGPRDPPADWAHVER
ncbi:tyrosine-protein phosphatase non-receptor type 18 isoform X1 [Osmerus eperlanus]|uniref:tyrosine-protein phosphatase non-receptor type 18 isoform X1 n=1 Tax=Osmerus eperlanus TaxID=29151 RepID=UPI002E134049